MPYAIKKSKTVGKPSGVQPSQHWQFSSSPFNPLQLINLVCCGIPSALRHGTCAGWGWCDHWLASYGPKHCTHPRAYISSGSGSRSFQWFTINHNPTAYYAIILVGFLSSTGRFLTCQSAAVLTSHAVSASLTSHPVEATQSRYDCSSTGTSYKKRQSCLIICLSKDYNLIHTHYKGSYLSHTSATACTMSGHFGSAFLGASWSLRLELDCIFHRFCKRRFSGRMGSLLDPSHRVIQVQSGQLSSVFFGCTLPYTLAQCLRECLRTPTRIGKGAYARGFLY